MTLTISTGLSIGCIEKNPGILIPEKKNHTDKCTKVENHLALILRHGLSWSSCFLSLNLLTTMLSSSRVQNPCFVFLQDSFCRFSFGKQKPANSKSSVSCLRCLCTYSAAFCDLGSLNDHCVLYWNWDSITLGGKLALSNYSGDSRPYLQSTTWFKEICDCALKMRRFIKKPNRKSVTKRWKHRKIALYKKNEPKQQTKRMWTGLKIQVNRSEGEIGNVKLLSHIEFQIISIQ
jgi:hypothetical protein